MTTDTASFSFRPKSGQKIPIGSLSYFRARNRNRAFDAIRSEFEKSGISQAELSRRLDKKPEVVSRWLSAPTKTFNSNTLSDLLFAVSGGTASYDVEHPTRASEDSYPEPDWLKDRPEDNFTSLVGNLGTLRNLSGLSRLIGNESRKIIETSMTEQPGNSQFVKKGQGSVDRIGLPTEYDLSSQIGRKRVKEAA